MANFLTPFSADDLDRALGGAKGSVIDQALAAEGKSGQIAELAKSIYQQESGSGRNTATSNAGAVGGMQVLPATFARMADADWDINDPVQNARAGVRYIDRLLQAAGGDARLAAAGYYGGEGAIEKARRGEAVSDPRNPGAPNTLQYADQVTGRLGTQPKPAPKKGYEPSKSPDDFYSGPRSAGGIEIRDKLPTAGFADYGKAFMASGLDAVGAIGTTIGQYIMAPVANAITGTSKFEGKNVLAGASRSLLDSMSEGGKRAMAEAQMPGDLLKPETWELPTTWQGLAMAGTSGLGSLLPAVASMFTPAGWVRIGAGAAIGGSTTAGSAIADVREGLRDRFSKLTHEQMLEASPAYAEAFRATGDEGKARQAVISSAENWAGLLAFGAGAVGGAFNNKFLEDLIEKKGVSELLGKTAESKAVRGAIGAAGGVAAEGGQEALEQTGQNVGENVGLGRPALEDATRDTFGQAVGGALVGSAIGGAGGAMSRHIPKAIEPPPVVVPPELAPVAAKAAEGNSPLSSAAMAGATSQINAANNDPLKARVDALVQEVRSSGLLQSMREIGIPGLTSKELLDAIAQAQNPTVDQRVREQAINSIEMAMGWAQDGLMPGRRSDVNFEPSTDLATTPPPAQPGTSLQSQQGGPLATSAPPAAFDPNTVEGQATRVDNMIGGPKALPAPMDQAGPVQRSVPSSSTQLGYDPTVASQAPAPAPTPSPAPAAAQQQPAAAPAAPARIGNETVSQPKVATPAGEGSPYLRKRKAALAQLAKNGFDRVEKRDGTWVMVNGKTSQKFVLDGPADAALARKAVADNIHSQAADTNTAPTEAQAKAGNYKKARVNFDGLNISVENPIGSTRSGKSPDGKAWQTTMSAAYGYVQRTEGADGDQHDVYIAKEPRAGAPVFVVDQYNDDGSFDEHKTILGATSQAQAERIYDAHFSDGSGPRRRKAVTEMSMDQFKDWLKSSDAVKPAAARTPDDIATQVEPENTKLTVRDGGKDVTIDLVGDAQLPDESPARGPKASQITKRQAAMIKAVAQVFGRQVAFFDEGEAKLGDGFVRPGDDTIYINQQSGISPLAVFGHELLHMVRRENPKAYDAMALAISTRVRHSDGFRADYYGIDAARAKAGQVLSDGELEELVADLNGNLMTDPKFWQEVFDQVAKSTPAAESKSIIARLVEQVTRLVAQLAQSIKQPGFAANSFVTDLDSIRAAVRDGLADYVKSAGLTKAGMQAEVLRAQQAQKSAKRDITQTPEFKRWFGDSKVVDADGKPLVVYHGSPDRPGSAAFGSAGNMAARISDGRPFFVTPDVRYADHFARGGKTSALYARIENPVDLDEPGVVDRLLDVMRADPAAESTLAVMNDPVSFDDIDGSTYFLLESPRVMRLLRSEGYDGAVMTEDVEQGVKSYAAFRPEQIKSATGNNGAFDPTNADITKSTSRQPEVGIHYSTQPRANLDGSYYGRGLKGLESERLAKSTDSRIKKRIYFYANEGTGIHPESGVGGFAHEIKLPKLYDAVANPDRLWNSGDLNATESRILDAGYDGYWIKNHPTKQGIGVILGKASQGLDAKQIPNPATAAPVYQAPPEPLKKGLMSKEVDAIDVSRIPGAKLRMGTLSVPAESLAEANAELERIGALVRFSRQRLATPAEQIEAVRKEHEGKPTWMKAPDGSPTNLTERQWLHVRTPSFKAWFGDWEKFAGQQGGVWNDGKGEVSKAVGENGEPLVVYHGTDKGGFAEFERPGGTRRGDLGIFTTPDLAMAQTYVHRGRGGMLGGDDISGASTKASARHEGDGTWSAYVGDRKVGWNFDSEEEAVEFAGEQRTKGKPGVYALFLNIRNPNESDFEGANWDGYREGAHIILDADGEQHYEGGKAYFTPGEAEDIAERIGGTSERADDHYETTDSVVREARRMSRDGAIIRQVRDDGGGNSSYAGEPADVFVALDPSQVKSADFNSGEYSVDTDDIRFSRARDVTETPEFRRWFGDSKVVDADGKPLVVYHGTSRDVSSFAPSRSGALGPAIYFTASEAAASKLSERSAWASGQGRGIMPVYLKSSELLDLDEPLSDESVRRLVDAIPSTADGLVGLGYSASVLSDQRTREMIDDDLKSLKSAIIKRRHFGAGKLGSILGEDVAGASEAFAAIVNVAGFDGIVKTSTNLAGSPSYREYAVFRPEQIKSAIGNNGAFDPTNPDITKSAARPLERIHDMEMSTRAPSAKPTKDFEPEDAKANLLISNFEAGLGQAKWLAAVTDLVEQYPNYRAAPTAKTPEQKLERMVRQMTDNLLWLHDQVPADIRNRSKLWYDGARAIVDRWVKRYDLTDAQVSGILAVLSPQKDWFMNVSLANRVIDVMADRQAFRWSKQMDETAARIFGKVQHNEDIEAIRGQTLQDLDDDYLRAMWIRVYDEAHNSRAFMIVSPEGDFIAEARTKDGTLGKVAWGGNSTIAKAVRIYGDGDFDAISEALGRKHKVRNFYNNILVPASPNGHVAIDTHAVAAALLRPLSGNSTEVMDNFGGPKSAHAGLEGVYALYEEAYHRAAAQRGLLPREMQSITWEAVRGLFLPTFKSQAKNVDAIDAVWNQYRKGRLSYENARQQTLELAGGIEPPSWAGRDPGAYVEDEPAAGSEDVSGDGVSWSIAEADGRNDRSDTGAAAPKSAASAGGRGLPQPGGVRRSARRLAVEGGASARDEDGSLIGLPRDFTVAGQKIRASHWAPAEEVARKYMASRGLEYDPPSQYAKVDPERARRIAAAYEAMKHDPQNPEVKAAYSALAEETIAQYRAVIDSGLVVEFIDFAKQGDPYAASPRLATEDVRNNNHMWVFSTRDGFGSDAEFSPEENPLLAETEFEISGQKALVNDLFRVVHDYFGHVKEGVGFRADGEENTWRAHSAMFSPLAQRALTTETRGQNSWLNYGPYGETNRTAKVEDTHFADQKTGLLPEWVSKDGVHDAKLSRARLSDFESGKIGALLSKSDWAVLTAENPMGKPASARENAAANKRLEADLRAGGHEFKPLTGRYGDSDEHSYAVVGITHDQALALGRKYNQDAVLTRDGFVYQDGSINPATGIEVFRNPPENYFSRIGDTIFRVNIDFDTKIQPAKKSTARGDIESLLRQLDSGGAAARRAEEAIRARPDAARILAAHSDFLDTLETLDDEGSIAINCD